MSTHDSIKHVNIIKLSSKDQYNRWLDSVQSAANILKLRGVISDEKLDEHKLKDEVEAPYHQLKMAMLNSLSERLYKIVRANDSLEEVIPFRMLSRLNLLFKPQFRFNDLQYRKSLYRLELKDFENITDFVAEIRSIANDIKQIEDCKAKISHQDPSYVGDRDLLAILIGGLDKDKFETQIEFIERDDNATFETVVELLRGKEAKLET